MLAGGQKAVERALIVFYFFDNTLLILLELLVANEARWRKGTCKPRTMADVTTLCVRLFNFVFDLHFLIFLLLHIRELFCGEVFVTVEIIVIELANVTFNELAITAILIQIKLINLPLRRLALNVTSKHPTVGVDFTSTTRKKSA